MSWSDEQFLTRVAERARALGLTLAQLARKAGISMWTLKKVPSNGRRVDTLEKLAAALDWSLAEIMGHEKRESHPISVEALTASYDIVQRAAGQHASRLSSHTVMELTARIYDVLAALRRAGQPIDASVLRGIEETLAAELRAARR